MSLQPSMKGSLVSSRPSSAYTNILSAPSFSVKPVASYFPSSHLKSKPTRATRAPRLPAAAVAAAEVAAEEKPAEAPAAEPVQVPQVVQLALSSSSSSFLHQLVLWGLLWFLMPTLYN